MNRQSATLFIIADTFLIMRFKELELPIGKKMNLRMVGLDYKKHQLDTQLLGYYDGKSLLVAVLSKPGQILLQPGQGVSLDMALPTGQVQFETDIEYIVESPFLYLLLDYPLGVDFKQLRKNPRVPVDTPIVVTGKTALGMNTSPLHGYMLDVSLSGARIVLEKEITSMVIELSVGVMLDSLGLERDMELTAEQRKPAELSEMYPECGFAYGIEFKALDEVDDLFLRSFTQQEVARGRALMCKA